MEQTKKTTKASPKAKSTKLTEQEIKDLIIDITDKFVEIKNENSFNFSSLGETMDLVLCKYLKGYCYQSGLGVEKDTTKADEIYNECFESIQKLAEEGNIKAQLYLGFYYSKGLGDCEVDKEEAFDYFAQARMQGSTRARDQLFKFSEKVSGGKLDRWAKDKAAVWAEKAMTIENEFMENNELQDEQEFNYIDSLEKIASSGNNYAEMILAKWYEKGIYTEIDLQKAFVWYEKAANTNQDAMFYLAKAYHTGIGCDVNLEKAFEFASKASEKGIIDAFNLLGDLYYDGIGVEQNYDLSFEWHDKAAQAGCIDAMYKLGIHYYNAEGCKKDIKKCLQSYELAANKGYAIAESKLGACYQGVYGVEKDEKLSAYWFLRAALNGDIDASEKIGIGKNHEIIDFDKAVKWLTLSSEKLNYEAEYSLGILYEKESEFQDLDKSLTWYQKAAEHGNREALTRLGCQDEKSYSKDTSRFVYWYERANIANNSFAKMRLGDCYLYGTGTEQSNEKALSLYEQSAISGCALAQYELANFYYTRNKLVEKDDSKAVYYFDLAAKKDHVPAQMLLASCYENAFGCEKNINNAVFWYERAAALKNYEAEKKLTKFKKNKDGNWSKKLF